MAQASRRSFLPDHEQPGKRRPGRRLGALDLGVALDLGRALDKSPARFPVFCRRKGSTGALKHCIRWWIRAADLAPRGGGQLDPGALDLGAPLDFGALDLGALNPSSGGQSNRPRNSSAAMSIDLPLVDVIHRTSLGCIAGGMLCVR